jgi:predicted SprT family Zn-dependent metalloprotease
MNKKNNGDPTRIEYRAFQQAYDFFNQELFSGTLPHLLVTLQRRGRYGGYFAPKRFAARQKLGTSVHELALNPDYFTNNSDERILSVLVHEQAHAWQESYGKPSRSGYHNGEWGRKMKEIGLYPSNTGEPGGNETGQAMNHYIVAGGPYAAAYQKLAARGFKLHWQSIREKKPGRESKTKFTCPVCSQNAWAKPDALLICGHCETAMAPPQGRTGAQNAGATCNDNI